MTNLRYGLKEVANVVFFDVATQKPAIFFDTLKVSTIENESESAEARGGQGNGLLISWDFGRTATLNMQDALLSDASLGMLAGNSVKESDVKVVGRDVLVANSDKVTTLEVPVDVSKITVYEYSEGMMGEEIEDFTAVGSEITFGTTVVTDGQEVLVFYEYTVATGAKQVSFTARDFPATYRVVGDTVVRGQDGVDRRMQFVIPRAKLQSSFSLTMDVENVSTFDFNLDIMVDAGTGKLYDIIRLDSL